MIGKQIIAFVVSATLLVSQLGFHVIHHDLECCGKKSEIVGLLEMSHQESDCCFHQIQSCSIESHSCCSEIATTCLMEHNNHQDCCQHEVIVLDEHFVMVADNIDFKAPEFSNLFLYHIIDEVESDDYTVLRKVNRPPPKLIDSYFLNLYSFRC